MWRTVQDLCCSVLLGGPGALANGVLHWLVTQDNGRPTATVSFDLVEEKFQEMVPLRGLTGDAIYWHYELGVLGDWLCLYSDYGLSSDCEAWIMKEYSSKASWTSFLRFNGESNSGGQLVVAASNRLDQCFEEILGESMAACYGLTLAIHMGHTNVILETDGLLLMNVLKMDPTPASERGVLVGDICHTGRSFSSFSPRDIVIERTEKESVPNKKLVIVSFDLAEEKFLEMVPVLDITNHAYLSTGLKVLRDCLCLYTTYYGSIYASYFQVCKEYCPQASRTLLSRFSSDELANSYFKGYWPFWELPSERKMLILATQTSIENHITVGNPSTRDSKEVPAPNSLPNGNFFPGFGYHHHLDVYKMLRGSIVTSTNNGSNHQAEVEVLTLKINIWKTIQDLEYSVVFKGPGTCANDTLHWLAERETVPNKTLISM
ncbi:unnamed protein product [Dovyalis caffra]|uniref:RNase H type-1 domain-containing protein n=1 Tax=Dovyalis caffra TaxID=77055 RepID=A0AAV1RI23_9ROSI|nr:unnamed protein product [Dovyalis caffra]